MADILLGQSAADTYFTNAYSGYRLKDYSTCAVTDSITLKLEPIGPAICPKCGQSCYKFHSMSERQVRCAPRDGFQRTTIVFPLRRVRCACGSKANECISWLVPHSRITNKLAAVVQADLRAAATCSSVAGKYHIDWTVAKRLDKEQLQLCFSDTDLSQTKHLIMDEFSVSKGHRYATVVMDADTHQVIFVCKGKSGKEVKVFFEMLREKGYAGNIRSVAMDMNACFPSLVREYLPNAVVLYDGFHVLQMFTRDVLVAAKKLCQERVLESLCGKALNAARRLLASAQWVLVKPQDSLDERELDKLQKLREHNQLLNDLYPLADMIRNLWKCKNKQEAARLLENLRRLCLAIANAHNFEPARTFAKMLKRRVSGIIEVGRFGFSSCPLEGANNKIKVLKRIAYGFRDFEYFRLKIHSILPGKTKNLYNSLTSSFAVLNDSIIKCCFHVRCFHAHSR